MPEDTATLEIRAKAPIRSRAFRWRRRKVELTAEPYTDDGNIRDIGLHSTRPQALYDTVVTIADSKLADSPVENVSAEPSRRVVLELGLLHQSMDEAI